MANTLYLLRHAKASPGQLGVSDFERPLNDQGMQDASELGHWFEAHFTLPVALIASPAIRAAQTAYRFTEAADISLDNVAWSSKLYLASADTILAHIRQQSDINSLMVIGHNPGIEDVLHALCPNDALIGGDNEQGYHLPTCGLACINFEGDWQSLAADKVTDVQKYRVSMLP